MGSPKEEFLNSFLPSSIRDLDYTQINLDITDLSLSDVLRNINKLYPQNTRSRMAIEGGEMAVGVMCKTDTIDPYNGVLLLVCGKGVEINITSCEYIVLSISEDRIKTEEGLMDLISDITGFLVTNYSSEMRNLPDFYRKFVYNETELYDEPDEYNTEDY